MLLDRNEVFMTHMISPVGDNAILVSFGDVISPDINRKIQRLIADIQNMKDPAIHELIPAYTSLLIQYDAMKCSYAELKRKLEPTLSMPVEISKEDSVTVIEIPTMYGGEYGPDLTFVAEYHNMTEDEVVDIHSGTDYLVYMLGFIPGFAYLGGMDRRIATPRLQSPRQSIPAGSVGIAGEQTGIYPSQSPGGWQIIGRTPVTMYDIQRSNPSLVSAGQYVRYIPINEETFRSIEKNKEQYTPVSRLVKVGDLRG